MAGLYIHIPFCKTRCIYCGFYSTTMEQKKDRYIEAVCQEMTMRPSLDIIKTIYIGGGTPSQLNGKQLHKLFKHIYNIYNVDNDAEVTIECNPDDISSEFVEILKSLPVNRVSIGIQTFSDKHLQFIRRRHSSTQAINAVELVRNAGINNISIDLMFGFPNETMEEWQTDLSQAIKLNCKHISAYSLMYEEGTPLYLMANMDGADKVKPLDDETVAEMYKTMVNCFTTAGYEHYEISNFAKPTYRSRHNSSYWQRVEYIGIGAAAHSYDLRSRWWNRANLDQYIEQVESGQLPVEESEDLNISMQYNDMVTTALRTCEGISMSLVRQLFGDYFLQYLRRNSQKNIARDLLEITGDYIHLTKEAVIISDSVISDLIYL